METSKKKSLIAKIVLLITTIIWGSSFVVLKDTLQDLPMYFVLIIRFLGGGILLGIIFIKKWKNCDLSTVWRGGVTGIILAVAYITQTIGLKYTTPGTNAFLTATYVVMVPFMMWAVTKKAPTVFNIIAAVVAVIGIGLVSLDGANGGFNFMGEGMTIVCSVFFALQIIFIAVLGKGKDGILFTVFELLFCGIIMLIFYLVKERNIPIVFNFSSSWKLAYLTVLGTAFALLAMTWGLENNDTNSSSLIMSLEAVFGVIFGIIVYKEKITLQLGVGFALIFIALICSEYLNAKFIARKNKVQKNR